MGPNNLYTSVAAPRYSSGNPTIRFSCTALAGTNKKGHLPVDEFGYYEIAIGALNMFNSIGQYYPYEAAKDLFEESSSFMRRIQSGCLKGECGHPKPEPGQSMESFAQRVMTLEETRISHHIREIWLDHHSVTDETGRPIVAIMAKVKPAGPYGPPLKESLENGLEDVCFSIRAFTEDYRVGNITHRALRNIVTWDMVTEPGLSNARKYRTPSLESHADQNAATLITRSDCVFTREELSNTLRTIPGYAAESAQFTARELFGALGWDRSDMPAALRW